jgi:UDP-glucose 4-epimerase
MIIVTGACGFVGFYLVNQLHKEGFRVLAVDKSGTEEVDFFRNKNISFVQMDITKEEEFNKLPKEGIEAFVNLACVQPANMPDEKYDPAKYISVNVLGVVHILKYCSQNNIKKVIHTISHRNVQGLWEKGEVINEESPRAIKFTGKYSMFSISESAAADVIENFNQEYGMKCVILRLPSVYGFGHHESFYKDGKIIKTGLGVFIENAVNGKTFEIWGDKDKGRDVVYVKDVVSAVILAVKSKDAVGMYNIASGKKLSLQQQVESVIKVFSPEGARSKIVYVPEKPNSIDSCVYDITKAKRELGWEPKFSFEDMLRDYKEEMERGNMSFLLNRKHRMINED